MNDIDNYYKNGITPIKIKGEKITQERKLKLFCYYVHPNSSVHLKSQEALATRDAILHSISKDF